MVKTCRLERKTVCLALAELGDLGLISRENGPDVPHDTPSKPPTRWGLKRVNPEWNPGSETGQGVGSKTGQEVGSNLGHEGYPNKEIQEGGTPPLSLRRFLFHQ
jgi:hypothetical protein